MWQLIAQVGRVSKTLVWDREAAIGPKGTVTTGAAAFAGTLATRIVLAIDAGSGVQGHDGTQQRVPRDLVPARTILRVPGGFNVQLSERQDNPRQQNQRSSGTSQDEGRRGTPHYVEPFRPVGFLRGRRRAQPGL